MAFGLEKRAGRQAGGRVPSVSTGHDSVDLRQLRRADLVELLVSDLDTIEDLQGRLSSTERALDEATATVERLKAKLDEKDETIERLKGKLNGKDETLDRLKGKLDAKDAQIEHLKDRLNMKDERIRALTGEGQGTMVGNGGTGSLPRVAPTSVPVTPQVTPQVASVADAGDTTGMAAQAWQDPIERLWQDTSHLMRSLESDDVTGDTGRIQAPTERDAHVPSPGDTGAVVADDLILPRRSHSGMHVPRRSQGAPRDGLSFRNSNDAGIMQDTSNQRRRRISLGGNGHQGEPSTQDTLGDDPLPGGLGEGDGGMTGGMGMRG